jgi:hypothetical protein
MITSTSFLQPVFCNQTVCEIVYVIVTFHLEKEMMFIEVRCAELFLDLYNFHLMEILKVTYPAARTGKMSRRRFYKRV